MNPKSPGRSPLIVELSVVLLVKLVLLFVLWWLAFSPPYQRPVDVDEVAAMLVPAESGGRQPAAGPNASAPTALH